jgi:hypothetical protein
MIQERFPIKGDVAMDIDIVYVGVDVDVDDTQYHGSALNKHTGEVMGIVTIKRIIPEIDIY